MKRVTNLIAFDLDGTLVDSKKDISTAVNLTLAQFGVPQRDEDEIAKYVGTGVWPLVQKSLEGIDPSEMEKAFPIFTQFYLTHIADYTTLYEGMREVLAYYSSIKKVVLTNKMNRFVGPLLSALKIEKYFVGVYGRDSFPTCKPDPLPLLEIAKIHKVQAEQILMVGDTETDIYAGQRAGTKTCAVMYGFGEQETLLKLNPSLIIDSPLDLIEDLKGYMHE